MSSDIQSDYYWCSAQRLAVLLGECIRIKPNDTDTLQRIPSETMKAALSEMCNTLSFMESDAVLYNRIEQSKEHGPAEIRSYLNRTALNIDELFSRFLQFEKAVIRDTKVNYDFGVIMMEAVQTKGNYLRHAFLSEEAIDIREIKRNVSDVRNWVCKSSDTYGIDDGGGIGAFVWGRLLTIAGVKISSNNLVLGGMLIPGGHWDISLAVAAYMSEMAGAALMMLPSRKVE